MIIQNFNIKLRHIKWICIYIKTKTLFFHLNNVAEIDIFHFNNNFIHFLFTNIKRDKTDLAGDNNQKTDGLQIWRRQRRNANSENITLIFKVSIDPEDALLSETYVPKEGEPPGPAQV